METVNTDLALQLPPARNLPRKQLSTLDNKWAGQ